MCRIDAFLKSDQNRSATRLLTAYNEGDIEEIKKVASSSTVSNLDHAVIHLNDLPHPNHNHNPVFVLQFRVTAKPEDHRKFH